MTKKIAIIPQMLGSNRVKDKNLILIDGRPMAYYVLEACKQAGVFDEIYVNSEHEIFRNFANDFGVKFYKRDPKNGGTACIHKTKSRQCNGDRCQTHDHFLYDFMKNVPCDYLFLVHSTSPLITPETIRKFVDETIKAGKDAMFSVMQEHIETYVGGTPVNFNPKIKKPTQSLPPIQRTSWALTAWKPEAFMKAYEKDDPSDYGPTFLENPGIFPIGKIEGLDIDEWEDLHMVESILSQRHTFKNRPTIYYDDKIAFIDANVERVMSGDGVTKFEGKRSNQTHVNLEEIKQHMGKPPWSYLLIYSDSDQAALICQPKEEGCRFHYHATKDEWWVVMEGAFDWHIQQKDGTERVVHSKKNDIVFLPKGTPHKILCTSDEPGIRLAHGARDMPHIYLKE